MTNPSLANWNTAQQQLNDHYFLSPNGQQYNGKELATNDSRVLGGIIDKDWIQFVNHSMDTSSGTAGIYHGIIYNYEINPYVESTIISDSVVDFGYPNIASTGINPNEKLAFSCGSGITACVLGLASTIINNQLPVIYDGSWAEYGLK